MISVSWQSRPTRCPNTRPTLPISYFLKISCRVELYIVEILLIGACSIESAAWNRGKDEWGAMEEEAARRAAAARYIKLGGVSEKSVQQLRALHLALFPVRYSDSFYSVAYTHLTLPT